MTRAERIISKWLRANPPIVHMTDEGVRRLVGVGWRKRRGLLMGISNGFLRVKIDGSKTISSFHESFWRIP